MRKQQNIGYAVVVVAVLLCLLGTIGLRLDGEVNDIPTPNVPERTFFADEPLPKQAFGAVISATLTLNWDRDDIYVVIAGEDEKKSCESLPQGLFNEGSTTACTPYDADVVAGGDDGEAGLVWEVDSGVHYAGIGTMTQGGLPDGTEVNLTYVVHLQAGFGAYFLFALIGVGGLAYTRVE